MDWIGFPPPLLGPDPRRLRVLGVGGTWLALEKPRGVVTHSHPLYPDCPALDLALQQQQDREKPELVRICGNPAGRIKSAYFLGAEYPGIGLFSWDPSMLASLRNSFGSRAASFEFLLLGKDLEPESGDERRCGLPLMEARGQTPPFRVSHRHGKQAETLFTRMGTAGSSALRHWRATTNWMRPGQLFLHAWESGIGIPGDPHFSKIPPLYKESYYRRPRAGETPLLDGPPIYLSRLRWEVPFSSSFQDTLPSRLELPEPREWSLLRNKLQF